MAAPEPRTVLVRGLPPGATAALLERLFGHLGPVRRCFVVTEKGRPLAVDWAVAKDKYQGTQGAPKPPEGEQKGKEKQEKVQGEEEEEDKEKEEEEEAEEEEDEEEEEEEQQEDDDEEEGNEDEKEEPPRKRRQRPSDVGEGRTVFIRNLSFDTEEEELEETLAQFGGVSYVCLVLHPHTGTPKGSAFAQFETPEGAQKCIEAAQEGSEGGGLRVGGRLLRVDPALSREQARGLQGSGGARPRSGTRNLYLAREGAIRPGSRAAEGVSDSDMAKRARFEELKRRRLQDPNIGVSRTRLCLHNLPKALDTARLRALLRGVLRAPGGAAPRITECRVMRELRGQGQSLGFAFVEFGEHEEALGALRRLNNNPELFGAHKRPIVEFALEDRRKLRLREQRIQRGLAKAKAKAKAGPSDPPQAPPEPPQAHPDPPQGHPAPPAGSGGPQAPPGTPPGTPWAGFCTQGPGHRGAPGAPRTKVLAVPSHRGPKIRKRDKGKAQPPPKPPKAPKASRRREKLRVLPPQSQRRRRGGSGGAEARFQELVERYKRKILGSSPPTARKGKWFES
ncbi:PREDICTED: RNA-binding protein 28 [Sturnus vulgaris]|uniref:RNA-binding protein 28 n=1 Tax=Sturnus vulgaris TaxID=9172 RepID=UPI000719FB90|nr:PREDICTED: RNA-binding protein 28 [Sturnus vulgaris]